MHGYNPDTKTHIVASATAKNGDNQVNVIKAGVEVVALPDCKTQTDANEALRVWRKKQKMRIKRHTVPV